MNLKIRLYDKEFAHINSFCGYDKPKEIEWIREGPDLPVCVYSERCLDEVANCKGKIKIAWLNEPRVIHDYGYRKIENGMYKKFDYVLTHNQELISKINNGIWYPNGGSWFFRKEWNIYPKTKRVSIIASNKNWTIGHKLRHEVIAKLRNKIDFVCGKGYLPVDNKMIAFKDYMFQIVIENCDCRDYWTDKLIDCFATGTIPIIWNSGWIEKYFHVDGMILWQSIDELAKIIDRIDKEYYHKKVAEIELNFDLAKKYCVIEDYIYGNFFRSLIC